MQAIVFCLLIAVASAGKVEFTDCGDGSVKEVRVDQCHEGQPCKIKRGSEVTIEVDFVPKQNSNKADSDVSAKGMKLSQENMCGRLQCPLKSGQTYTIRYHAKVPRFIPKMNSEITGKLNGDSGMISCAKVRGQLA